MARINRNAGRINRNVARINRNEEISTGKGLLYKNSTPNLGMVYCFRLRQFLFPILCPHERQYGKEHKAEEQDGASDNKEDGHEPISQVKWPQVIEPHTDGQTDCSNNRRPDMKGGNHCFGWGKNFVVDCPCKQCQPADNQNMRVHCFECKAARTGHVRSEKSTNNANIAENRSKILL